jgi:hypothetical protein
MCNDVNYTLAVVVKEKTEKKYWSSIEHICHDQGSFLLIKNITATSPLTSEESVPNDSYFEVLTLYGKHLCAALLSLGI